MDLIRKHVDTVIVLTGILGSVFWMNGRFNEVDSRFNQIETRLKVIETVLVMKDIMPKELSCKDISYKQK